MTRCLLLINKISGNAEKVLHRKDIPSILRRHFDSVDTVCIDGDKQFDFRELSVGYDAMAVCGGDGTFNKAINSVKDTPVQLIYVPCGTLNDTAKCLHLTKQFKKKTQREIRRIDLGELNGELFSYVAAAGTFTAIGHDTKTRTKKRLKLLAYFFEVLKEYRVHRINAEVTLDGRKLSDEYTLVMAINSSRCFGFRFNRLFDHKSGTAHLLLIKSPKKNGFLGKAAIFFPFFRAFFVGFDKPVDGKRLKFLEFTEAELVLAEDTEFTVDGEKRMLNGTNAIHIHKQKMELLVF